MKMGNGQETYVLCRMLTNRAGRTCNALGEQEFSLEGFQRAKACQTSMVIANEQHFLHKVQQ